MPKRVFEVVFSGREWVLRRRGKEAMDRFPTREEALEYVHNCLSTEEGA